MMNLLRHTWAFSGKLLIVVRNIILSVFTICLTIISFPTLGSEYSQEDIEPVIVQILFTKSDIGLISKRLIQSRKDDQDNIYFLLNRNQETGKEVSKNEFMRVFGKRGKDKLPNYYHDKTQSTSDGTDYEIVRDGYCKWVKDAAGYKQVHSKGLTVQPLKLNGELIKTTANVCNTITTLEHVNGNLWIGTGYSGDHGNGPGQGVIIQRRDNGKLIKNLTAMEDWTSAIRRDPYTPTVWVAASYVIHVVNLEGNPISTYRFYHDFDHVTGRPTIYLSRKPGITNPFALVARAASKKNRLAFYEAAKDIHQDLWPSFDLYSFYMCCNIDRLRYPVSLNVLVPPLLTEIEEPSVKNLSSHQMFWAQTLCRFDDPRVIAYFKSKKTIQDDHLAHMQKTCVRKFEK